MKGFDAVYMNIIIWILFYAMEYERNAIYVCEAYAIEYFIYFTNCKSARVCAYIIIYIDINIYIYN